MEPAEKENVLRTLTAVRLAIEGIQVGLQLMPEFADMPAQYREGYADAVDIVHAIVVKSAFEIQEKC